MLIIRTSAEVRELRRLRREIADYCEVVDVDLSVQARVMVAVNEAFTNVIQHAYAIDGVDARPVQVRAWIHHALFVAIRDFGRGYTPDTTLDNGKFGDRLMRRTADHAYVIPHLTPPGTEVVFQFLLAPSTQS